MTSFGSYYCRFHPSLSSRREAHSGVTRNQWIQVTFIAPFPQILLLEVILLLSDPVRNKCEFTFGFELAQSSRSTEDVAVGNEPNTAVAAEAVEPSYVSSLGFRVSSFRDGVLVDSPQGCPNVSEEMKLVVQKFTEIIRLHPDLPVYDQHKHSGVSSSLI